MMCVLLLVVPLFWSSVAGLSPLIAALAFLTFTWSKKYPFCCLNQGSCLQPLTVTISPTHSNPVSSTTASQQPNTEPHTHEAETSFFGWQTLRCPFSTSGWDGSSPFISLHLPKPQQGWNGDAVYQQEKKFCCWGEQRKEKMKPTLPPSLACSVPAPSAALVHCVSGWK